MKKVILLFVGAIAVVAGVIGAKKLSVRDW